MQHLVSPESQFRSGARYGALVFKVGQALPDAPGISSHCVPEWGGGFFTRYPAGVVVRATSYPFFVFRTFENAQHFLLTHPHPAGQIWECTCLAGSPAPSRVFPSQTWHFWPRYWELVGTHRCDPALTWDLSSTIPIEHGSLVCSEIRIDRRIDPDFYNPQHIQTYTYQI